MIIMNAMLVPGLIRKKPLPGASTLRERIIRIVAEEYGIRYSDVFSKSRKQEISMSRHISILLIRHYDPSVSLKTLGYYFGGRDHTTVMHSLRVIKDLMSTDEMLRVRIDKIQGMI